MKKHLDFTEGKILSPLLRFAMPTRFWLRVPVSFPMSRIRPVSLFLIGLATPCSTVLQILLCIGCMVYVKKT